MSAFVLDCSVTMAWAFDDEDVPHAVAIRDDLVRSEAFVPWLWTLEVGNALLVAEQRGRLTTTESDRFVELLGRLPLRIEATAVDRVLPDVLALGRRTGLSSYDAAYLELAGRLGLPLATLDERLRRAAGREGVAVL
ncbi:MAG: type II toxin-antitoxin system VapC family toxin [Actinobacteria bacterium]|nr:type II toxin-antitoxin system VapC family toxin [Actinomycetota bacterium]